jgi:pilus assembly protein CpaE
LSEYVLLIAQADVTSLWSAARVAQFLGETGGRERVRLVLNRYRKVPGFQDTDAENAVGCKLIWKIPNHYFAVSASIDRGHPLMRQSHSEISRAFSALAGTLTEFDDNAKRSSRSMFRIV